MQLSVATTAASLKPFPKVSAGHASFPVLAFAGADGVEQRIGIKGGTRFYSMRGGEDALLDAAEAAKAVVAKTGQAHAILAAHAGMLFVAPVFGFAADGSRPETAAALDALAGASLLGRHGRVLGLVGADRFIDTRDLAPTLGSGRG